MLVALKETGNFSVGKQRVHPLKEARVEDVRLIHDEADLLALAAGAAEDCAKILVEVIAGVLVRDFDLEDAEAVHPGNKAR